MSRPPDVTYVELGKTLTLNVTYQTNSKVAVIWVKNGKNLYTTFFGSTDPRVSIKGQATLVLINTTLSDNGTYENRVETVRTINNINLIVIIQGMYTITVVCFYLGRFHPEQFAKTEYYRSGKAGRSVPLSSRSRLNVSRDPAQPQRRRPSKQNNCFIQNKET